MSIALPGARGLFSHIQNSLRHVEGKRVVLTRGIHQALADFQWMTEDPSNLHTRLYEIMPLQPMQDGNNNASGFMCGGSVLPGPTAVPWTSQPQPSTVATSMKPAGTHPIVWRAHFPTDIIAQLVSWGNPEVQFTNSDLELVGSVLHNICMADFLDTCKRTTLSLTYNTAGLWWQSKGLATSTLPPYHLPRIKSIHQQFHYYLPPCNCMSRVENGISDRPYSS